METRIWPYVGNMNYRYFSKKEENYGIRRQIFYGENENQMPDYYRGRDHSNLISITPTTFQESHQNYNNFAPLRVEVENPVERSYCRRTPPSPFRNREACWNPTRFDTIEYHHGTEGFKEYRRGESTYNGARKAPTEDKPPPGSRVKANREEEEMNGRLRALQGGQHRPISPNPGTSCRDRNGRESFSSSELHTRYTRSKRYRHRSRSRSPSPPGRRSHSRNRSRRSYEDDPNYVPASVSCVNWYDYDGWRKSERAPKLIYDLRRSRSSSASERREIVSHSEVDATKKIISPPQRAASPSLEDLSSDSIEINGEENLPQEKEKDITIPSSEDELTGPQKLERIIRESKLKEVVIKVKRWQEKCAFSNENLAPESLDCQEINNLSHALDPLDDSASSDGIRLILDSDSEDEDLSSTSTVPYDSVRLGVENEFDSVSSSSGDVSVIAEFDYLRDINENDNSERVGSRRNSEALDARSIGGFGYSILSSRIYQAPPKLNHLPEFHSGLTNSRINFYGFICRHLAKLIWAERMFLPSAFDILPNIALSRSFNTITQKLYVSPIVTLVIASTRHSFPKQPTRLRKLIKEKTKKKNKTSNKEASRKIWERGIEARESSKKLAVDRTTHYPNTNYTWHCELSDRGMPEKKKNAQLQRKTSVDSLNDKKTSNNSQFHKAIPEKKKNAQLQRKTSVNSLNDEEASNNSPIHHDDFPLPETLINTTVKTIKPNRRPPASSISRQFSLEDGNIKRPSRRGSNPEQRREIQNAPATTKLVINLNAGTSKTVTPSSPSDSSEVGTRLFDPTEILKPEELASSRSLNAEELRKSRHESFKKSSNKTVPSKQKAVKRTKSTSSEEKKDNEDGLKCKKMSRKDSKLPLNDGNVQEKQRSNKRVNDAKNPNDTKKSDCAKKRRKSQETTVENVVTPSASKAVISEKYSCRNEKRNSTDVSLEIPKSRKISKQSNKGLTPSDSRIEGLNPEKCQLYISRKTTSPDRHSYFLNPPINVRSKMPESLPWKLVKIDPVPRTWYANLRLKSTTSINKQSNVCHSTTSAAPRDVNQTQETTRTSVNENIIPPCSSEETRELSNTPMNKPYHDIEKIHISPPSTKLSVPLPIDRETLLTSNTMESESENSCENVSSTKPLASLPYSIPPLSPIELHSSNDSTNEVEVSSELVTSNDFSQSDMPEFNPIIVCVTSGFEADSTTEFESAEAPNGIEFERAESMNEIKFEKAESMNETDIESAEASNETEFESAVASNETEFESAKAPNKTEFESAKAPNETEFESATAPNETEFVSAKTPNETEFETAKAPNETEFESAKAPNETEFESAKAPNETEFEISKAPNETELEKIRKTLAEYRENLRKLEEAFKHLLSQSPTDYGVINARTKRLQAMRDLVSVTEQEMEKLTANEAIEQGIENLAFSAAIQQEIESQTEAAKAVSREEMANRAAVAQEEALNRAVVAQNEKLNRAVIAQNEMESKTSVLKELLESRADVAAKLMPIHQEAENQAVFIQQEIAKFVEFSIKSTAFFEGIEPSKISSMDPEILLELRRELERVKEKSEEISKSFANLDFPEKKENLNTLRLIFHIASVRIPLIDDVLKKPLIDDVLKKPELIKNDPEDEDDDCQFLCDIKKEVAEKKPPRRKPSEKEVLKNLETAIAALADLIRPDESHHDIFFKMASVALNMRRGIGTAKNTVPTTDPEIPPPVIENRNNPLPSIASSSIANEHRNIARSVSEPRAVINPGQPYNNAMANNRYLPSSVATNVIMESTPSATKLPDQSVPYVMAREKGCAISHPQILVNKSTTNHSNLCNFNDASLSANNNSQCPISPLEESNYQRQLTQFVNPSSHAISMMHQSEVDSNIRSQSVASVAFDAHYTGQSNCNDATQQPNGPIMQMQHMINRSTRENPALHHSNGRQLTNHDTRATEVRMSSSCLQTNTDPNRQPTLQYPSCQQSETYITSHMCLQTNHNAIQQHYNQVHSTQSLSQSATHSHPVNHGQPTQSNMQTPMPQHHPVSQGQLTQPHSITPMPSHTVNRGHPTQINPASSMFRHLVSQGQSDQRHSHIVCQSQPTPRHSQTPMPMHFANQNMPNLQSRSRQTILQEVVTSMPPPPPPYTRVRTSTTVIPPSHASNTYQRTMPPNPAAYAYVSPNPRATPQMPDYRATPQMPDYRATPQMPDHRATQQMPDHRATQQMPDHRATQQMPDHRATQQMPDHRATQQMPDHRATQQMPDYRATPQMPDYRATPQMPDYRATPQMPDHRATQQMPDYRATQQMPDYRATPQMPDHRTTPPQVPDHRATPQVPDYRATLQMPDHRATLQVPDYRATPQVSNHVANQNVAHGAANNYQENAPGSHGSPFPTGLLPWHHPQPKSHSSQK